MLTSRLEVKIKKRSVEGDVTQKKTQLSPLDLHKHDGRRAQCQCAATADEKI